MPSLIKINAGEFAAAVKFVSGKLKKDRKTPFPVLIEEQEVGKITITDAEFHKKGMDVSFEGIFSDSAEVDARHLLKITSTYPHEAELVICVDNNNFMIQHQKSQLSIPRLDKAGKKTQKKDLPHIKPPAPQPEQHRKRAEFDHTWGFSARVPMPKEVAKKEK